VRNYNIDIILLLIDIYGLIGLKKKSFYKLIKRSFFINIFVKNDKNLNLKKRVREISIFE